MGLDPFESAQLYERNAPIGRPLLHSDAIRSSEGYPETGQN